MVSQSSSSVSVSTSTPTTTTGASSSQQSSLTAAKSSTTTTHPPILPGMDGRLYWQQQQQEIPSTVHTTTTTNSLFHTQLEPLPLTVQSLLEHPVRSCQDDDNEQDCGILTAQAQTSLLAFDTEGQLQWKTTTTTTDNDELWRNNRPNFKTALLQRKDYIVQQVSTLTGKQSWNSTLGMYHALEFDLNDHNEDSANNNNHNNDMELPSIVFLQNGLMAIDPTNNHHVLWQIQVPHILASVFGLSDGKWKSLQVLSTQDIERYNLALPVQQSFLPKHSWKQYEHSVLWSQLLLQQQYTQVDSSHNTKSFEDNAAVWMWKQQQQQQSSFPLLPSPTTTTTTVPNLVVHANGILLSWSLLIFIVIGFMLFVGLLGRRWYYAKKSTWLLNHAQIMRSSDGSSDNNTNVHSSPPKARSLDDLEVIEKEKDQAQRAVSDPGNLQPENSDEKEENFNSEIPLVRYSRYDNEFEEIKALGEGGFGSVYCCKNTLDGRQYAIKKVTIRGRTTDEAFQQRLERVVREVKILARLEHHHIVRYYAAWLELDTGTTNNGGGLTRRLSTSNLTDNGLSGSIHAHRNSFSSKERLTGLRSGRPREFSALGRSPLGWNSDYSALGPNGSARFVGADWDDIVIEDSGEELEELPSESESMPLQNNTGTFVESSDSQKSASERCSEEEPTTQPKEATEESTPMNIRHTLYIQMQLCSDATLQHFLSSDTDRQEDSTGTVDIPKALNYFLQISRAVEHVHEQGLIHRDLKPSNCFIDNKGLVKVGDFGLSRESNGKDETADIGPSSSGEDHTAGVGTRSYASPEQMRGSDYGASTDVYSLGVILFELCYPMKTAMERNVCLADIRKGNFPSNWQSIVGKNFPTLESLISKMLALEPSSRPSASDVTRHIDSVLGEFTIHSFDPSKYLDFLLLRVLANPIDDILSLVKDVLVSENCKIVKYGLQSGPDSTILEFAVDTPLPACRLLDVLTQHAQVQSARQVVVVS